MIVCNNKKKLKFKIRMKGGTPKTRVLCIVYMNPLSKFFRIFEKKLDIPRKVIILSV